MPSRPKSNTPSETAHQFIGHSNHKHNQLIFCLKGFSQLAKRGRSLVTKAAKDWENFASHCPVTNIALLLKIMEKVIAIQTLNYLAKEGLLAKMQSTCRQFYSTELALLQVIKDILLSTDSRQEVILVLLDLSSDLNNFILN